MNVFGFYKLEDRDTLSAGNFVNENIRSFAKLCGARGDEINVEFDEESNGPMVLLSQFDSRRNNLAIKVNIAVVTTSTDKGDFNGALFSLWQIVTLSLRSWVILDQKLRKDSLLPIRLNRVHGYDDVLEILSDLFIREKPTPRQILIRSDVCFVSRYVADLVMWHHDHNMTLDQNKVATIIFKVKRRNYWRYITPLNVRI